MTNGWRRDRLPEIVRSMASRPRHEALRGLVTELLREGFGATFSETEHERYLVDNSGRVDVAWGATVPGTCLALAGHSRLGDSDWLDGDFSAGDLLMVTVLRRLESSGILNAYPTLTAYIARGEARPAYKRAFDAQLAVFTG